MAHMITIMIIFVSARTPNGAHTHGCDGLTHFLESSTEPIPYHNYQNMLQVNYA